MCDQVVLHVLVSISVSFVRFCILCVCACVSLGVCKCVCMRVSVCACVCVFVCWYASYAGAVTHIDEVLAEASAQVLNEGRLAGVVLQKQEVLHPHPPPPTAEQMK